MPRSRVGVTRPNVRFDHKHSFESDGGALITATAGAVIVITLLVFYLVEIVVWIPLEAAHAIRERRHRPAKKVNRPTLRWKL